MKNFLKIWISTLILLFAINIKGQNNHQLLTKSYSDIKRYSEEICKDTVSDDEYEKWIQVIKTYLAGAEQAYKGVVDSLPREKKDVLKVHLLAIETYHVSIEGNITKINKELKKKVPNKEFLKKEIIHIDTTANRAEQEHQLLKTKLTNKK